MKMYYSGCNLVLTLIVALLCGQSKGIWPFTSVHATPDSQDIVYPDANAKRVAIIGAGAAGSSTAYYLQQFASESGLSLNITVFERSSYVGGRSTTVNAYGNLLEPVELGASLFVEANPILKNSSEALGLKPKESTPETDGGELLGIWDGKEFVYKQKESGWYYWDVTKLLWKYGLAPIRTQRLVKDVSAKLLKLYEYPFFPFRSLSDRALDLGLTPVTSMTGEQFLAANNIGSKFATDIIQATTRVNYGQNLNLIHGLGSMVCMAVEGAMQIQGGNWQIFAGMLNASNASTLLNTAVTSISKSKSKYSLKTSTTDSLTGNLSTNEESFDTIILAAPLQFSQLALADGLIKHVPDEIPYVTLHVTLFTSPHAINQTFLNLSPKDEVPSSILTTLPKDAPLSEKLEDSVGSPGFFSISTLRTVVNPETLEKEHLYKIFSPKAVTSSFLSEILNVHDLTTINSHSPVTWFHPHKWFSYPYLFPRITFEDPELARGFYYTSGMESFISTMETSALMGKNVARLVVDDYLNIFGAGEGEQKVVKGEL
ncbi:Prenylcysteine oxidase [Hyaloscypha bicolor E]|uniref:Prenylcysteine oxidase n=1 Tax=Hyaloscypha bicolor E TaxID=1095630 RepID=A0A2J6TWF4_9HELO|nr:Prenylcysteine oxidase [Hyaloscypha bicolor E]PMD67362.1 Prenylcysteine oxidase [Hyaloscypha bicolor E]